MAPSRNRLYLGLWLVLGLILTGLPGGASAGETRVAAPLNPRLDSDGNPLPWGALVRLGSTCFHSQYADPGFLVSPDSKTIALADRMGVVLLDAATGAQQRFLLHLQEDVRPVCFSPDGRLLITKTIHKTWLWDASKGRELWHSSQTEAVGGAGCFLPDGKLFLAWCEKEGLSLRDSATGKLHQRLPLPATLAREDIRVAETGRRVAVRVDEQTIHVLELPGGKVVRTFRCAEGIADDCIFLSPDGQLLAATEKEMQQSHLWDVAGGREVILPRRQSFQIVGPSLNGSVMLVMNGRMGCLEGWDPFKASELWFLPLREEEEMQWPVLSPDGRTFACLYRGSVGLFHVRTGKLKRSLSLEYASRDQRHRIAFADLGRVVIAHDGHKLRLWQTATGQELHAQPGHREVARELAFSRDGRRLATASHRLIHVWESATGKRLQTFQEYDGSCTDGNAVALSGTGGRLAAWGGGAFWAQVWDVDKGRACCDFEQPATTQGDRRLGILLALSADGSTVASTCNTANSVAVCDAGSGKLRASLTLVGKNIRCLQLSPDDSVLAMGARGDGLSRVSLRGVKPDAMVWCDLLPGLKPLCFSEDGRLLATVDGQTAYVCELASGDVIASYRADIPLTTIGFTPSHQVLAAGIRKAPHPAEDDNAVLVWDVLTGKEVCSLNVPGTSFEAAVISPASGLLATALADTTVLIWDLQIFEPRRECALVAPGAREGEQLWKDLASPDASCAYRAVWKLTDDPVLALPLLARMVHPEPANAQLSRLIADLDADTFAEREAATKRLARSGPETSLALQAALHQPRGLEAQRRIERVQELLVGRPLSLALLRQVRAVQVLEYTGTAAARRLLERLAEGRPDALLTCEAKASLRRMGRR